MHLIPFNLEKAVQALSDVPVTPGGARAFDLRFHFRSDWADIQLDEMDELADYCRFRFLKPDGDVLVTNDRRLDEASGSADLLIID